MLVRGGSLSRLLKRSAKSAPVRFLRIALRFFRTCPALSGYQSGVSAVAPCARRHHRAGYLGSGALTLDSYRISTDLQTSSCAFAADYGSGNLQPDFQSNGTPGISSFNVQLLSLDLRAAVNATHPCPAAAIPTGLVLQPNRDIAVRSTTHAGSAELDFGNQVVFVTNRGFFEFKLNSLDLNGLVANGDFRLLLRNDANASDARVIFASGSFTMPVHRH